MVKIDNKVISPYPINPALCVLPTEKESQYEAFQSIFAAILSANMPPIRDATFTNGRLTSYERMTSYEILCVLANTILTDNKQEFDLIKAHGGSAIFFEKNVVTHYISSRGDPYETVQARNTQGFCQMFAVFISLGDTGEFYSPVVQDPLTPDNFARLAFNTYICGLKLVQLLYTTPHFSPKFMDEFDALVAKPTLRKKYGFQRKVTLQEFVDDFVKLSLQDAIYYLYDQKLDGIDDNEALFSESYTNRDPNYETNFNILHDSIPHHFYAHKPSNLVGGKRKQRKTKKVKKLK